MPRARRLRRKVNGQAAGQQADRVEDRCLKHFSRRRSRDAFPQIKEIGDDEDREDRRLGDDETGHRDLPARWQMPRGCCIRK